MALCDSNEKWPKSNKWSQNLLKYSQTFEITWHHMFPWIRAWNERGSVFEVRERERVCWCVGVCVFHINLRVLLRPYEMCVCFLTLSAVVSIVLRSLLSVISALCDTSELTEHHWLSESASSLQGFSNLFYLNDPEVTQVQPWSLTFSHILSVLHSWTDL